MAQLKSSVVQGSLRVTDTTYTNDLNISSVTASKIAKIDANKNLTSGDLTASEIPNLSTDKLTSGTLPVAQGGTGIATATYKNAIIAGNASTVTNAFQAIRTKSGAFYATSQDGAPSFGTLPIAQGGTGLTDSPSMLTNLGSTTAADILTASPRPGITGTLGETHGGTGQATYTKGDILYSDAANSLGKLSIGTANHILIATTSGPRWTASANLSSNTSTKANEDAWDTLTLGNNVNRTSTSAHSSGKIILYNTDTSSTTITHGSWSGSGLTVSGNIAAQGGMFIASIASSPTPYIRFDTRAGTSSLSTTGTITYTTINQTQWACIYCQVPAIKNTYATAGDASSTVTHSYNSYPTRFSFREYSYNDTNAKKVSKYETYLLPEVTANRTGNAAYEIITTKNLTDITKVGTVTAGTWNGTKIAVEYGGTGTTTAPTKGGIIYGASTSAYASTGAGTAGQVLTSNGANAPTWETLEANAAVKTFAITWASGTSYTYSNSWITADAAVVATDLQMKTLPGIVTWTIPSEGGKIKFECATAPSNLSFNIMMLKEINYDS